MPDRVPHVLLVEDNTAYARLTSLILEESFAGDLRVTHATTLRDALALLEETAPDVVLVDLGLPDAQGTDVVIRLREAGSPPVIVLSGLDEDDLAATVRDAGAAAHVPKGRELQELGSVIRSVLAAG